MTMTDRTERCSASPWVAVVLLAVLGMPAVAHAQVLPSITPSGISFPLENPPQPVSSATVARTAGNPGARTLSYWIVTNTLIGQSSAAGPFWLTYAPNTMAGSQATISWAPVSGAVSYDVLRTLNGQAPQGACNCAVATGVTGSSTTDSSESLSAYTVAPVNVGSLAIVLANVALGPGTSALAVNGAPLSGTINAATYSGGDCGAKVNAADAAWAGTAVEIDVTQSCGTTWTTAPTLSLNHSLRFVQGGTYTLPAGGTLAGNNLVYGLGDSTMLQLAAGSAYGGAIFTVNGNSVALTLLNLDGNQSNQTNVTRAVSLAGGIQDFSFTHNTAANWRGNAILAVPNTSPLSNVAIDHNVFANSGYDMVSLNDVDSFTFANNVCSNWGTISLSWGACLTWDITANRSDLRVQDNTFTAGTATGYSVAQGSNHPQFAYASCEISGNTANSATGYAGMGVECLGGTVSGNHFLNGPSSGGIWRQGIELYGSNVTIANNSIQNGMMLLGTITSATSSGITVIGNRVVNGGNPGSGNTPSCFQFGGSSSSTHGASDSIAFRDNQCDLTAATATGSGFFYFSAALLTNLNIEGNTVLGNPTYTIGANITTETGGSGPVNISYNHWLNDNIGVQSTANGNLSALTLAYNDTTGTTTPAVLSGGSPGVLNTISLPAGASAPVMAASLTTTSATSDAVTVTGMTSSGHCSLTPTNASAATNVATTYISAAAANQITVKHTATAGMTYQALCTAN